MGLGNIEGVGDFLNGHQLAIANRRNHQDTQGIVGIAGKPHSAFRIAATRGRIKHLSQRRLLANSFT
jgi:hypothetical protein